MPWLCLKLSFLYVWDIGFRGVSSSAKPLVKKRSPQQNFVLELYNQRLEITKKLYLPIAYTNTQAFPQTAPIVRTRFVTNLPVLDSHMKRPRQYHLQSVGLKGQALVTRRWVFRGSSYIVKFPSPLESFCWRWVERLLFFANFPSPSPGERLQG